MNKDWREYMMGVDINESCDNFIHHTQCSFNLAFPLQEYKYRKSRLDKWVTRGILVSRQNLQTLAERSKEKHK